jgi:hypothetical protein
LAQLGTTRDSPPTPLVFGLPMQPGEFANQSEFRDYADAHDLAYVWEGTNAFAKRWRLAQLSRPGEYHLVEVSTKRGRTKALLFPRAILRAEFEANAPLRKALEIKRERLRAKKVAKQRSTQGQSQTDN